MKARGSAKQKLKEAMQLCNLYLIEPSEEKKRQLGLGNRKGSVFQILDENGKNLATYSTLQQVRAFLKKKIDTL
ncbi:MAG: hypothetical protein MH252_07625 [Thermosynechococcaceae cyanobacterium MS004]|nr:hypothetical protein [Thermosynechococcaceae cyanobacterium MS004]